MIHASPQPVAPELNRVDLPREVVDCLQQYEFNRPLVSQLIVIYLRDAPQLIAALRLALRAPTLQDPVEILHQLKSLSANFGKNATSQKAEQFEKLLSETSRTTLTEDDFCAISNASQELASKLHLALAPLGHQAGAPPDSGCNLTP